MIISRIVYNCIFFKKEIIFFHTNRGWGGGGSFFHFCGHQKRTIKKRYCQLSKRSSKNKFCFFYKDLNLIGNQRFDSKNRLRQNFGQFGFVIRESSKLLKWKIRILNLPCVQRYKRFESRFDPNLMDLRIVDSPNHILWFVIHRQFQKDGKTQCKQ